VPFVLWLLRHGEALPAEVGGDAERALSPAGERAVSALAARLGAAGWRPARVFTSPLRRARETADRVIAGVAPDLEAEPLPALVPDAEPEELVPALRARDALQGDVLIVGHQPLVGRLAARFAGTELPFAPAALIGIAFDDHPRAGTGRVVELPRPGD
jgi:phosphohistidine phosphatase